MKIAVIGSGITGLSAAHALHGQADLTLFEAGSHFGGHANTVDVTLDGVTHGVDTGFLVFNERTYPGLIAPVRANCGVATAPSDMSFSVQVPGAFGRQPLEWSGSSLDTVFCAARATCCGRASGACCATCCASTGWPPAWPQSATDADTGAAAGRLPEGAGLSATPSATGTCCRCWAASGAARPTRCCTSRSATMMRFCHNHGLLQVSDRPQWYTVAGGSRDYVRKIVAGLHDARLNTPVRARAARGTTACASPPTRHRALRRGGAGHATPTRPWRCWPMPTARARRAGRHPLPAQPRRAAHRRVRAAAQRRAAWAAWNYERAPAASASRRACACTT